MPKKRRRKNRPAPADATMHYGVEAARWSPNRTLTLWPSVDPLAEGDVYTLTECYKKARALYTNSASVRMAAKAVVQLTGVLTPRPMTADEEWNRLARDAFLARANDPNAFDASGRLSWVSAQNWLELRAFVDGDALCVLAEGADGGGMLAFYAAPQVTGGADNLAPGCKMDPRGRVTAYTVQDYVSREVAVIPASAAVLYTHSPDPVNPRTMSELVSSITTAQDLHEINAYTKAGVKAAASFGVYETKSLEDKNPAGDALGGVRTKRQAAADAAARMQEPELEIAGVKALSLAPGRELHTLHDNRPSNETRAYTKDLRAEIALGIGLPPEAMYYLSDMGSASTRYLLEWVKAWREDRQVARVQWCQAVWRHIIGLEVAAGRLRPCRDANWQRAVRWINRNDPTIDRGRETAAAINLIREGLLDADDWTLATTGKTVEEIAAARIHDLAHVRRMAEDAGLTLADVWPGSVGNTAVGQPAAAEGAAENTPLPPQADGTPE